MKGLVRSLGLSCVLSVSTVALAQPVASEPAPAAGGGDAPALAVPPPATQEPSPDSQPTASASTSASLEMAELETEGSAEGRKFHADMNLRAQNTWFGPSGGLRLVDASSGPVGTARLQFGVDYFTASDYLDVGDQNKAVGGVLALSLTPAEHFEAFASLSSHANSNSAGDPILLQVAGDLQLGVKGFTQVQGWLGVGADVRIMLLNTIGDLGVILKGTSIGLRGAATADLRRVRSPVPLLLRANLEYLIDNSSELIEDVEDARYDSLRASTRLPRENEDRHLVTRIERFALGINRVDMLSIGLGGEVPLEVARDFYISPLLEWRIGIPVNRQSYNCLSVITTATVGGDDGCLAVEGLAAAPSTLTFGARVLPPVRGLSGLLAFEIGLLGNSTFVRELAPNRPWSFMLALAYAVDTRVPKPEIRYVRAGPSAPQVVNKTRLRGVAVERGFGTAILGAIVRYPDFELSPQLTSADGGFISYEFDPGPVNVEITHPDYEPGTCSAVILPPARAGSSASPSGSAPAAPSGLTPADASPSAPAPAADSGTPAFVELRCELTARPRSGTLRGSLVDEKGVAVAGVSVEISGPSPQTVSADSSGSFVVAGLPVGDYVARVDSPAYLLKTQSISVVSSGDATVQLVLVPKPKESQVTLTAHEVKIRGQIMFKSSSAEIDERSTSLLTEIADVLLRNPQAASVQVQGHTDNVGDPEANLALSQQRAEAVVQWLVQAGVGAERLEAKGYGDGRPIVPNLTPGNRARNRRVQFIVKD